MVNARKGFALIDLLFVCGIIGLLSSIALPRLALAKQSAGSASAIGSLRAINSAQLTYALTCGNGFYAPKLSTLGVAPPGTSQPFLAGGLTAGDAAAGGDLHVLGVRAADLHLRIEAEEHGNDDQDDPDEHGRKVEGVGWDCFG